MFQKLRILIENFHNFDERFPAALNKLHSKCPLKNFWWVFFLWKHQECFVNSEFFLREFEPFFRKISGQNSKVALRANRKTFWGKTNFLRKIFFPDFSDFRRKLSRALAKKSDRMGNLLWFLCVKGSILKKDGSFKTFIYFAIFFRRRTKTNWVLPEKISMFLKAGFCVPRTTFSVKKEKIEVFFGSSFLEFERRLNWLLRKFSSIVVKISIDVSSGTFLGNFPGQNW